MHLSRALTAKLAACILAVTAVITPSFAASVGTVVSDSGLNVRAEASAEAQVLHPVQRDPGGCAEHHRRRKMA